MHLFLLLVAATRLAAGIYIDKTSGVIAPCNSPLYCQGEILKAIQLAKPFEDSKTYVDLPTLRPVDEVIAAFDQLPKPVVNGSELQEFLSTYFGEPGGEIMSLPEDQIWTNATFLEKIDDPVVQHFLSEVTHRSIIAELVGY